MKSNVKYVCNDKLNVHTKFGEYRRNFHATAIALGGTTEPAKHEPNYCTSLQYLQILMGVPSFLSFQVCQGHQKYY